MKVLVVIIFFLYPFIVCYSQRVKEYNECAVECINEKNYQGAISYFTRIIEISPKDSFAYFDRAMIKKEISAFKEAILDFTRAIEIDSKNADNYFLRAITKDQFKDYEGAILDFDKTLEIESENPDAYYFRGVD
ncbi:MAG: hypothetical protein ABI315_13745 [Bacteroidia bacterium]